MSRADDAEHWGIAAFTGRSPAAAEQLRASNGVYALAERTAAGDEVSLVGSIVVAHDGADISALAGYIADPRVSLVTLTVTEKGYCLSAAGELDTERADVAADVDALVRAAAAGHHPAALSTMPGRLAWSLMQRPADAPPLAVISCDNMLANGEVTRIAVEGMLAAAGIPGGISARVGFIGSSVDRITPRTTPADVAAAGDDQAARNLVVTEPYASWIIGGPVAATLPRWREGDVQIVDDVSPFEKRKLWMLNGAHSVLAYGGLLRGHTTVAEAFADHDCLREVSELWDIDEFVLSTFEADLDLPGYRAALAERFANSRIRHELEQIAADGSVKLAQRIVPVLRGEHTGDPAAAAVAFARWIQFVMQRVQSGAQLDDVRFDALVRAAGGADPVAELISVVDAQLGNDDDMVELIRAQM